MGLKTLVREDLARRGKTWTIHAPQAVPNKSDAARLGRRQRGFKSLPTDPRYTMPGSYRK